MIKQLIKVASELDAAGFTKEADQVDAIIKKIAGGKDPSAKPTKHTVKEKDTLTSMTKEHGASGYTVQDNLEYNKTKNPVFDEKKMRPGSFVYIYCDGACEAN
jgi:nucleoid-associated protein YgaU